MNFYTKIIFIFLLLSLIHLTRAEDNISSHWQENGLPYIQNFSPKDYKGEIQNFEIVQDSKGFIYSANTKGVLVYDGVSWELIQTPSKTNIRTLRLINDTIYVGSLGDFGYLAPDHTGKLAFVSLLKIIPENKRNFQDVYEIIEYNNAIFFRTRHSLYKLENNTVKVNDFKEQLGNMFLFNDDLFIVLNYNNLYRLKDDSLSLVPISNNLLNTYIRIVIPFNESKFLICTFEKGLFLFDGKYFEKFITKADNFLTENKIYSAANLNDSLIAVATSRGVVVIDKEGNLCQVINKSSGLRDEFVLNVFVDREKGLWLALNNGIARVETPSPISRFYDELGIESFVESIIRFNGKIYVSTDRGVYYLDSKNFPFPKFKKVSGFTSLTFAFTEISGRLLAGSQGAVYEIKNTIAIKINDLPAKHLYNSKFDTSLVYVGLIEGLAALKLEDNKWKTIERVPKYSDRVISISEDEDGFLWIGTPYEGIVKAKANIISSENNSPQLSFSFIKYFRENGLPAGHKFPFINNNKILIATSQGLKYYDREKEHFFPDTTFGSIFADVATEFYFITKDKNNSVWIVAKQNDKSIAGKAILNSDGSYTWYDQPYLRINDLGNTYLVYPEVNGTVWFGGSEGIVRYSPHVEKHYDLNYSAVIRKVKNISNDSTFYNGNYHPDFSLQQINYNNSLRFEFAALSYDDSPGKLFQYKLEGYDENWSEWSSETWKEYTGLSSGDYNFRTRAKNIYNHISEEASFAFVISPPWYQQWWANLIYILILASVIFTVVKVRVRQLEKRNIKLEKIISERTATIRHQTNKLKELDKLKSRFFANISHEFRTPLTLILGILEKYLRNSNGNVNDFKIMQKNAKRLLQLINQLLELSKFESGTHKIEVKKTELITFVRRITSSFISLADQKKLKIFFNDFPVTHISEHQQIWIYIDRGKIETVLYNLLSNAIKFTHEEGKIFINVIHFSDYAEIKITNTGTVIPEEHLDKIFNRFYQIEDNSGSYEGTGIGLALVKELTELHHGKIKVESNNSETTFTVSLLSGTQHFSPEEILDGDKEDNKQSILTIEEEEPKEIDIVAENDSNIVLIVEDHSDLRNFISEQLKNDYMVIEAEDGEKGVKIAEEKIPDLIISDIMMPKMNGYDLCSKVKKNIKTSHIPVILLTAKASLENKLEGLETGADDYLIKPFNTEELKTRVKNLINIRQKMREKFCSEMFIKPTNVIVPSNEKIFIEKLTCVIENHIEDENFSVENLSSEMGMSRVQLHRKIKAISNQSASEFIRSFRLQRAAELIKQGAGNFTEIAYKVGFNSQAYFNKSFQKMFGITPGEFKKKNS